MNIRLCPNQSVLNEAAFRIDVVRSRDFNIHLIIAYIKLYTAYNLLFLMHVASVLCVILCTVHSVATKAPTPPPHNSAENK